MARGCITRVAHPLLWSMVNFALLTTRPPWGQPSPPHPLPWKREKERKKRRRKRDFDRMIWLMGFQSPVGPHRKWTAAICALGRFPFQRGPPPSLPPPPPPLLPPPSAFELVAFLRFVYWWPCFFFSLRCRILISGLVAIGCHRVSGHCGRGYHCSIASVWWLIDCCR